MSKPLQSRPSPMGAPSQSIPPEIREVIQELQGEIAALQTAVNSSKSLNSTLSNRAGELERQARTADSHRQQIEGRIDQAQSSQQHATNKQKENREILDAVHRYAVKNSSGEQIPAYSVVEITGKDASANVYTVGKPSAADIPSSLLLFVGKVPVAIGANGYACSALDGVVTANLDGVPASTGVDLGTEANAWTLKRGNLGFNTLNAANPAKVRAGGSSNYPPVIAKTTALPTNNEYPCDFYADGKHELSTGSGTCEVLSLNMSEDLPIGTWIVCHPTAVQITGGA